MEHKNLPITAGYYWFKPGDEDARIVEAVWSYAIGSPLELWVADHTESLPEGDWEGPIPMPDRFRSAETESSNE